MPRVVVIGVGNPDRGDDGVGPSVARSLVGRVAEGVRIVEVGGDLGTLMDAWEHSDVVVIIDALYSGAAPGTVRRFDAWHEEIPRQPFSTHGLGVPEAIELARAIDRLPPHVIVIGIEGKSYEAGAPLSIEVAGAVEEAARQALAEVAAQNA